MIKIVLILIMYFQNLSIAGESLSSHLELSQTTDLDRILKKRYLRVLTTKNAYDYYIYQGKSYGMQYEMIKEFLKFLNHKYQAKNAPEIVFEIIPVDFDQLIPMLNEGKGDIIAVGLTRTEDREVLIDFTTPYQIVNDVIVTRKELKEKNWKDKVFVVPKSSSYEEALRNLNLKIQAVDKNFNFANIMEFVSLGKYDYTLVNSFWAKTISKRFENLAIIEKSPFRENVKISWGVRKNNPKLKAALNEFMPKVEKGSLLGNLLGYKYFYDIGKFQTDDFNLSQNKISPYDSLIKKYGKKYNWDWRLLSALAFQESRFNQNIVNKWGAIGMFQVKQMTANEPYVDIPQIKGSENIENNIHAGTKYLTWIKKRYFDDNKNMLEEDKIRMSLASYNAGPGRVLRAIKLTKKMGLNPNIWFRNVELAIIKLGFNEPVVYVSEINKHYVAYSLLGIKL